jgi:predicted nucleic acid-binding protein
MTLLPVSDFEGVLGTAIDTGLSFYDASYLHTAKSMVLTLSIEDERLTKASRGLSLPTTSLEALK